jgi:hypothetical protein
MKMKELKQKVMKEFGVFEIVIVMLRYYISRSSISAACFCDFLYENIELMSEDLKLKLIDELETHFRFVDVKNLDCNVKYRVLLNKLRGIL